MSEAKPLTYAEINEKIADLGALRRDMAVLEAEMNQRLADIKAEYERRAEHPKMGAAILEMRIRGWCDEHRAELVDGKKKSHSFPAGTVSWRKAPAGVELKKKTAQLIAILKRMHLGRFIRTTETIDKEAILADPDAVARVPGIDVRSAGEKFLIEPFEAQLSDPGTLRAGESNG